MVSFWDSYSSKHSFRYLLVSNVLCRELFSSNYSSRDLFVANFPFRDLFSSNYPSRDLLVRNFPFRDLFHRNFPSRDLVFATCPLRDLFFSSVLFQACGKGSGETFFFHAMNAAASWIQFLSLPGRLRRQIGLLTI